MFGIEEIVAHGILPVGSASCTLCPDSAAIGNGVPAPSLREWFPEQADRILATRDRFVETPTGFLLSAGADAAEMLERRGGLHISLPAYADTAVRFHLPGGFEARVRELDAAGETRLEEHAVVYSRAGGTAYWSATVEGYEEWLLVDASTVADGQPLASWVIEGATLHQDDAAVVLKDSRGRTRVAVTAPEAYDEEGHRIDARLEARGSQIDLFVDGTSVHGQTLLVDPRWVTTAPLSTARASHTATKLLDGRVLVAGGWSSPWSPPGSFVTAEAEIYDPIANVWSVAAPMGTPRQYHTATLLSDGRVLVTGGLNSLGELRSTEIYTPSASGLGSWSPAALLPEPRHLHTATLITLSIPGNNSRVMIVGGQSSQGLLITNVRLYDAVTDTWSVTESIKVGRSRHTAMLLASGKVLVVGGLADQNGTDVPELFDPSTGQWTTATNGTPPTSRSAPASTLLADGTVLVTGGGYAEQGGTNPTDAYIYTPATNKWQYHATGLNQGRERHTATLLSDGKVLLAGGLAADGPAEQGGCLGSFEIHNPATHVASLPSSMSAVRAEHTATSLDDGLVLLGACRETAKRCNP